MKAFKVLPNSVMMYSPTLDVATGEPVELEMVPLQIRKFRIQHPASSDAQWLFGTMDRECRRFGSRLMKRDGRVLLAWRT